MVVLALPKTHYCHGPIFPSESGLSMFSIHSSKPIAFHRPEIAREGRWNVKYKFSQGIPRDWEPEKQVVLISDKLGRNYEAISQTFPEARIILLAKRGYKAAFASPRLRIVGTPIRPHAFSDLLTGLLGSGEIPIEPAVKATQFDRDLGQEFPLRILLAEDNIINQKVALNMLKRLGYRADVANDGIEVLDALDIQMYDCILMDTQMPRMSGAETAREIHIRLGGSPAGRPWIIALSAHALDHQKNRSFVEAGMDDHLNKPLRVSELIKVLKKVPKVEIQAQ